jgi:quinol monooxygenase YgiN
MTTTTALPPIAATVTFRVADFAEWKKAFDSHEEARRQAGILRQQIHRGTDDPNLVCVYAAASDRGKLQGFFASDELAARQRAAGILGPPSVVLLVPQESRTVHDRKLAAAMVTHEVEDYDRWKATFDADGEGRTRAGIVGHGIARSATNPNVVVVYVQADSTAQLRALLGSSELAARMQKAGVRSTPEISYYDPQSPS